jgi:hypothetical protein
MGWSQTEAARLFQVNRTTQYSWPSAPDLYSKPPEEQHRKLDKAALAAHVQNFPDALLRQ